MDEFSGTSCITFNFRIHNLTHDKMRSYTSQTVKGFDSEPDDKVEKICKACVKGDKICQAV
jgi:hypothetical protein